MSSIKYRPEIDGLRAVAVIPVVLFHLGFGWIKGGYFGVDVFFVISGFLITSILLKDSRLNTFTYKDFWIRRIRRILPALLVMIIIILIVSYFIVFRQNLKSYAGDALSSMFSYTNIQMLLKFGDYWGRGAETSPFLHSWSLSVEEQFYILYPGLIALLVVKKISPSKILLSIAFFSFALFMYFSKFYPQHGFYLLPTRGWEMAVGGFLATVDRNALPGSIKKYNYILVRAGLVLILLSYFIFTGAEGIGISSILPVAGSSLIILFSSSDEIIGKILGNKVIVWIGKISYSLYLWHWPIIVLFKEYGGRVNFNPNFYFWMCVLTIISLSILSYEFVEKPTRKMKAILPLVCLLLVSAISISLTFKSGFFKLEYPSQFNQTKFYGLYYDVSPTIFPLSEGNKAKRTNIFAPTRAPEFAKSYMGEGIITSEGTRYPEILVIGDSHGAMWGRVIDEIGHEIDIRTSFFTTVGNNPLFPIPFRKSFRKEKSFSDGEWNLFCESIIRNVNKWKPKILIVSCKWSTIGEGDFKNLTDLVGFASKNNTNVLLINQPPIIDLVGDNNSSQYLSYLGYKRSRKEQYIKIINNRPVELGNNEIGNISLKNKNCSVVDINNLYMVNNKALVIKNNSILYYDDDHLSYQGTQVSKPILKSKIQEVLAK